MDIKGDEKALLRTGAPDGEAMIRCAEVEGEAGDGSKCRKKERRSL